MNPFLALVLALTLMLFGWLRFRSRPLVFCSACDGAGELPAAMGDGKRPCSRCRLPEYKAYREGIKQEIERRKNG